MDRRSSRPSSRKGFVPLARLPLPPGSPGPLHHLAVKARVRSALGGALAGSLADVLFESGSVVLVFAGDGWERALEPTLPALARRIGAVLGREAVAVAVRSDSRRSASLPRRSPVHSEAGDQDARTRLRRALERLAENRRARQDGD